MGNPHGLNSDRILTNRNIGLAEFAGEFDIQPVPASCPYAIVGDMSNKLVDGRLESTVAYVISVGVHTTLIPSSPCTLSVIYSGPNFDWTITLNFTANVSWNLIFTNITLPNSPTITYKKLQGVNEDGVYLNPVITDDPGFTNVPESFVVGTSP